MSKCCQNCRFYEADYPYKLCYRFEKTLDYGLADECARYEESTNENKVDWHKNYYDKQTGEIKLLGLIDYA